MNSFLILRHVDGPPQLGGGKHTCVNAAVCDLVPLYASCLYTDTDV